MADKTAYQQKLQARLDAFAADIDKLRAKAEEAEADAKIEYKEQIEQLQAQRRDAEAKLKELRNSGESAWEDMKSGMERAWSSMERAVENARSRFG